MVRERIVNGELRWCVVHAHPRKPGSPTDKPPGSIIKCYPHTKEGREKALALHRAIMAAQAADAKKSGQPTAMLRAWEPSAKALAAGEASHYLFPQCYKRHLDEPVYLADASRALGVVKLASPVSIQVSELEANADKHGLDVEAVKAKWPQAHKFWLYPAEVSEHFETAREYVEPDGASSWIEAPVLRSKSAETETPAEVEVQKLVVRVETTVTDDHAHTATVDGDTGDGVTSVNDGHGHAVKKWKAQKVDGHVHDVPEPPAMALGGAMDFKEGDEGTGVIQTHERGLTEAQAALTTDFGWTPTELDAKQLKRLSELSGGDAPAAYKAAREGDAIALGKLVGEAYKSALAKDDDKTLFALADPISVHTDLRLRPTGKPYWEGGEVFTPGNQFQSNHLPRLAEAGDDDQVLVNFKSPAEGEPDPGPMMPVLRGPLAWMKVGDGKPKVFPPGAVGSGDQSYSRFFVRDKFKWKAGIQEPHHREFRFEGGNLDGRYVFTSVPTGDGDRQWILSRPERQDFSSDVLKREAGESFSIECQIWKRDEERRIVEAVVLKPETTDAQGDIMAARVIEDASHNYLINLFTGRAKVGYMHNDFSRRLFVVESYIAPGPLSINGKLVTKGSWVLKVKVLDDEVWARILRGEIRGFSIGGKARVQAA